MRFSHGKKTRYEQAHESTPGPDHATGRRAHLAGHVSDELVEARLVALLGRFPANQQGAKAREGGGRQAGADDVNKVANGVSTDK